MKKKRALRDQNKIFTLLNLLFSVYDIRQNDNVNTFFFQLLQLKSFNNIDFFFGVSFHSILSQTILFIDYFSSLRVVIFWAKKKKFSHFFNFKSKKLNLKIFNFVQHNLFINWF